MGSVFKLENLSGSCSDSLKILHSSGSFRNINPGLKYNKSDNGFLPRYRKVRAPFLIIFLALGKSINHAKGLVFFSA